MKYPALTRVFSVVLAILCLLMLGLGVAGFEDAAEERDESLAHCDRLEERVKTYNELEEKLRDRESYEEAHTALKEQKEEHDSDAAHYKNDLATHTATAGGYTMGAHALEDAQKELNSTKQGLEAAKSQLLAMDAMKADMNNAIATCKNASAQCRIADSNVKTVLNDMPVPPTTVTEPGDPPEEVAAPEITPPVEPVMPLKENFSENPDGFDAALEQYGLDMEQYNADMQSYNEAMQPYNDYLAAKAAYEQQLAAFQAYPGQLAAYNTAMQGWMMGAFGVAVQAEPALKDAQAAIGFAAQNIPPEYQGMLGGMSGGGASMPSMPSQQEMAMMASDPAAVQGLLETLSATLSGAAEGLNALSDGLSGAIETMDKTMADSVKEMSGGELIVPPGTSGEAIIGAMDDMIKKGEGQIGYNLGIMYNELGKLRDEESELADKKTELESEAEEIKQKTEETEELKELERKFKSNRILLLAEDGIEERVNAGGEITESAEAYIRETRAWTQTLYKANRLIGILSVAVGVLGVLGLPAAFEKIKSRFMLIAPVVLCLLCAGGAEAIKLYYTGEQLYQGIAVAIFAAIQLLIILPKKKMPKLTEA